MSTPTIEDINRNPFIGRTATTPRPSAADLGMAGFPDTLARHQQRWDEAKRWDDANARRQADHVAKVAADREADDARRQANARADLETRLRREFLLNPAASEADWQAVKDQRVREALMASNPVEVAESHLRATGAYNVL